MNILDRSVEELFKSINLEESDNENSEENDSNNEEYNGEKDKTNNDEENESTSENGGEKIIEIQNIVCSRSRSISPCSVNLEDIVTDNEYNSDNE